jgi:hypothetical protein
MRNNSNSKAKGNAVCFSGKEISNGSASLNDGGLSQGFLALHFIGIIPKVMREIGASG